MGKVKIITDGCSDIPTAWCDGHGIDCVPIALAKNGGDERILSCEFDDAAAKRFYDAIRSGATFKPNAAIKAYEKAFERYAAAGDDIVYVAGSSALYPAFTAGRLAAKQDAEKYGAKILCVDTKTVGISQALVAVEAAKYAADGHDAQETFDYAADVSAHAHYAVTSDTLEYLKRAGKVKASAALFGNLFGIKPIVTGDRNGACTVVKKVKGRQNALDRCVEIFEYITGCDNGGSTVDKTTYVLHADCADAAEYVADKLKKFSEVRIQNMGAVTGALFGPTAVGLFTLGKSR